MDNVPDEKHHCALLVIDGFMAFDALDHDGLMTSLRSGESLIP